MRHETKCKFCGRILFLEIDDDYAALGDPSKLIPMAACNRCHDLRVRRSNIEARIYKVCAWMLTVKLSQDRRDTVRGALDKLTKRYALLVADWNHMTGSIWEPEFPAMLMDHPDMAGKILSDYWRAFRRVHQQEMQPA